MKLQEKVNVILHTLNKLIPNPQPQLKFFNDFTFLVAVMLSAQCTDAAVNKVGAQLFPLVKSPAEFIALGEENLKKLIKPCGLYNAKSRAIICTAEKILDEHNGRVPSSFAELEALPGVGHKTASVMISQYFGEPAFPVDTHIARLANRWGLEQSSDVKKIEKSLKNLFPKNLWNKLHLQLVLYGRKFCPARGHVIQKCPICRELQNSLLEIKK